MEDLNKTIQDLDILSERTRLLKQTVEDAITEARVLRGYVQGITRLLIKVAVLALGALMALSGIKQWGGG